MTCCRAGLDGPGRKGGVSGFMAGGKSLVFAAAGSLAAPKSLATGPNLTVHSFFFDEKTYPLTNHFILTLLFLISMVGLSISVNTPGNEVNYHTLDRWILLDNLLSFFGLGGGGGDPRDWNFPQR